MARPYSDKLLIHIREKKCINIRKFMEKIQKDLDNGKLPTKTQTLAKKYLKDI